LGTDHSKKTDGQAIFPHTYNAKYLVDVGVLGRQRAASVFLFGHGWVYSTLSNGLFLFLDAN
jgi:hypothetical protein